MNEMPLEIDAAVRLPLRLSQVSGLFPYDFDTMGRSVWSIVTILLVVVISGNLYVSLNSGNPLSFDAFITNMFRILSVVPWLSTSTLLMKSFTIGTSISRTIKQIHMVERRLNKRSKPRTVPKLLVLDFTIRNAVILCEIYAAYILVTGKPFKQFMIRLIGFYVTHFIQNVYELQFLAFIHLLASCFLALSKNLSPKNAAASLESYNDLLVASFELNDTFKFQNFVTVSNCFLLCIVDCYLFYTTSAGLLSPVGMNTFLRGMLRVYQMLMFMVSAANLTKQAKLFDEVLYTLTLADHTKLLLCDAKIKEHFNQRVAVVLTGWNIFPLDAYQLHSIAALIMNYFIILLQFGGSNHGL